MSKLTNKQQEFFAYSGTFGALLATTCLIQHMSLMYFFWIPYAMMLAYMLSVLSFILLALKKASAPLLLIISTFFVLLTEALLITTYVFSLVVLLLFVYSMVIVVLMYIEQLPRKLKDQVLAEKMEAQIWKDRI